MTTQDATDLVLAAKARGSSTSPLKLLLQYLLSSLVVGALGLAMKPDVDIEPHYEHERVILHPV